MPSPFYLSRARCAVLDDPALHAEILNRTGSDAEVTSIIRSLERFGSDASIGEFLVSPAPNRGASRLARAVVWNVRAIRH